MKNTTPTKPEFDFDSFRTDIINNEKFETFKTNYGFKTRQELDLKLVDLMRLDKKFYDFRAEKTPRFDIYVSTGKEGFLKVGPRVVAEYKKYLNQDTIAFDSYEFKEDGLFLKVKAS